MKTGSHGWGETGEDLKGTQAGGTAAEVRGGGGGPAGWRGAGALWVFDDAAVERGGGEGSSGMGRDRTF
jgi:hypothetical protein